MKFGKRLLDQCVEEWMPYYLNYKELKHIIKRVASTQKIALLGSDSQEASTLAAQFDPPLKSTKEERAHFQRELLSELQRINQFYLSKESEYIAIFPHQHEPQIKALLGNPHAISPEMEEFREFFEFCHHVDNLRNFTVLNYIGILKICKKYDKKTEASYKPQFTMILMKQPFYTSTKLAKLFTEVQCLFSQIVWHAKKIAPSEKDFSCPVCSEILHDPIVLSCTHRICRSCLARLCSTSDGTAQHSCPVCHKEFDTLDPANYHVDSILAKFVMSYFQPAPQTSSPFADIIYHSNPSSRRPSPTLAPMRDSGPLPLDTTILMERSLSEMRRVPFMPASMRPEPSSGFFLPYEKSSQTSTLIPLSMRRFFSAHASNGGISRRWLLSFALFVICIVFLVFFATWVVDNTTSLSTKQQNALLASLDNLPAPPLAVFPDTVFVGHKVNDVDSICSAIAAAHLFNGMAARADDVSREAQFVLNRFGLKPPPLSSDPIFQNKNWCLLDHNQQDKVPNGVNLEQVVCVIDHHQLQGNAIEFAEPNVVEIQPWGSTTSILAYKYFQARIELPRAIAGCLLAGIISDTVNLRSSTTTKMDRVAAEILAGAAGMKDFTAFANEMLAAKSDTNGLNLDQIILADYKEYTIHGRRIFFGVAESIHPKALLERKDEILATLPIIKAKRHVDYLFFAIVDVRALKSTLMGASEEEETLIQEAFEISPISAHLFDTDQRVSRKKDFMPPLIRRLRAIQLSQGLPLYEDKRK